MTRRRKKQALSAMSPEDAALAIEAVIRGFIARRRMRRIRLLSFREHYQAQFDTMEKLMRFRIRQQGAAFVIQRWFRSWTFRNKAKWWIKYSKMVTKYRGQKKLYRAIQKSHGYAFSEKDFDNRARYLHSSALVINRMVRGFLGKRRFDRIKTSKIKRAAVERISIVKLQSFFRKMLVINREPHVGFRYRILQRKLLRNNGITYPLEDAEGYYPKDFVFASRRLTVLFPHLRLGVFEDLEKPINIIQRNWRRYHATFTFRALVAEKKVKCAFKLQAWYRRAKWRRKIRLVLAKLAPKYKKRAYTKLRQHRAAVMIQSNYRAYSKHRWLKNILNVRRFCAKKIVKWIIYKLCVRRNHKKMVDRRMLLELTTGGKTQYERTELRWLTKYLWQGLKKVKNIEKQPHELQRIFNAHALNNGLDLTKIVKLMRDCKGLIGGNITVNMVELQFAKIKYGNDKRIDYGRLLDLLANLALMKFFQIDPVKGMWEDTSHVTAAATAIINKEKGISGKNVTANNTDPQEKEEIVPIFLDEDVTIDNIQYYQYGAVSGKAALITRFVHTYLMTLEDFQKAEKVLGSQSAVSQCQSLLSSSIQTMQRFVINRWSVRDLTQRLVDFKHKKIQYHRYFAACQIQRIVRGFKARRRCMKLAQAMYMKYVDGETDRPYWSNSRTSMSFWVKPKLLREQDSGIAIRMPPETEVYALYCQQCEDLYANCFCPSCNMIYCLQCYVMAHASGQRKQHTQFNIDHCIQCDFQVGTNECLTCKDLFCDSCYSFVHLRGRLRFHTYTRHGHLCYNCSNRAAQWREILPVNAQGTNNAASSTKTGKKVVADGSHHELQERHWCTKCYHEEYGVLPKETYPKGGKNSKKKASENVSPNGNVVEKLLYVSRAYTKHVEDAKKAAKEAAIAKAFQIRQEELARIQREKASITIQRIYRGYRGRLVMKAFIEERKKFLALRKAEDEERQSLWYWIRSVLGFAPLLDSDTPLERVKKVYPWYMHHIIAVCIENKWSDACKLMAEHDFYMKHHAIQKPSLITKLNSKLQLRWKQQHVVKCLKDVDLKSTAVDNASAIYYEAQISGAVSEVKLKKMKKQLNKLEKDKQQAIEKHEKSLLELKEAEQRVTSYYGPRRLQKLIADRRKNGLLLPFRVRMKRNSRYALVVQWISATHQGLVPPGSDNFMTDPNQVNEPQIGEGGYYDEYGNYIPVSTEDYWEGQQYVDPNQANAQNGSFGQGPEFQSNPFSDVFQSAIPEEGAWRDMLRTGEEIYIQGLKFTIAPSINKKKKRPGSGKSGKSSRPSSATASSSRPTSAKSTTSSQSDTSDGASSDGGSTEDGKSKSKKSKMSSKSSQRSDDSEIPDFDDLDVTPSAGRKGSVDPKLASAKVVAGFEVEVKEEVTPDHICLNRPWLLDDMDIVEVYKVVPRIFFMRPVVAVKDTVMKAYPTQKMIAITAITMHKISKLSEAIASMFEDESDTNVFFRNVSIKTMKAKYRWLSMSYAIVQMSYDFSLRRQFTRHLIAWYKVFKKYFKIVYNMYKSAKNQVKETPYEYWNRSLEKEEVKVYYELTADDSILLGTVKMDIKAPLEILREYIYRNFREKLNETVGQSFLFQRLEEESNREEILPREEEYRFATKSYAVERTDPKTFVSAMVATIVKDRERGRVFITEIIDKKPEEDLDVDEDENEENEKVESAMEDLIQEDRKKKAY